MLGTPGRDRGGELFTLLLFALEGFLYWRRQTGGRLGLPRGLGDRWALGLRCEHVLTDSESSRQEIIRTLAALLILQTAVDEGLGSCFFGIPPDRVAAVRHEFAIPETFDPVGVITLGHRVPDRGNAGSPARRARKPLGDVLHRGGWGTRVQER